MRRLTAPCAHVATVLLGVQQSRASVNHRRRERSQQEERSRSGGDAVDELLHARAGLTSMAVVVVTCATMPSTTALTTVSTDGAPQ